MFVCSDARLTAGVLAYVTACLNARVLACVCSHMLVCSDARLNAGGDARDNVCVEGRCYARICHTYVHLSKQVGMHVTTYASVPHTVYVDGCIYGFVHTYAMFR